MNLIDKLKKAGEKFLDNCNNDYSRFKAWDICYNKFNDNKKTNIDELSLHLAIYLASWGMYRNSNLLETNYKINYAVVKLIKEFQNKYKYKMNINNKSMLYEVLQDDSFFIEIEQLGNNIKTTYEALFVKINESNKNIKFKKITDTLQTKVILGTLGITPAYDQNFKRAIDDINKDNHNISKNFNAKSIKAWYQYYYDNYNVFEDIKIKTNYPPMKIIDMCLWQYGKDNASKRKSI